MNYIWFAIILVSIVTAGFTGRLDALCQGMLDGAQQAVKISISLIGIMSFWLGMMNIADKSGFTDFLAKILKPIARVLFTEVRKNDKAISAIAMNISANAMGLANAATPIGIKAMEEMQKANKDKDSASNPMCTFLAINTAGFQLVPATVLAVLAANGAKNPSSIILPTLIVTTLTFCFAIIVVKALEKVWKKQERKKDLNV